MFAATYRTKHWGLLLTRLLVGIMFVLHGWQKIDPSKWEQIGSAAGKLGLNFAPQFWGFMAMFSELIGGTLIILGFLYIPAVILTAITMLVAMTSDAGRITPDMPFIPALHTLMPTLMLMVLSLAGLLVGPGKFSIDAMLCRKMCKHGDCHCHHGACCTGDKCERVVYEEETTVIKA